VAQAVQADEGTVLVIHEARPCAGAPQGLERRLGARGPAAAARPDVARRGGPSLHDREGVPVGKALGQGTRDHPSGPASLGGLLATLVHRPADVDAPTRQVDVAPARPDELARG
jgi:hypothetical protein